MQPRNRFAFVYLIIGAAVLIGWPFIQNAIWPPPPKKPAERELAAFAGGGLIDTAIRIEAPALEQQEQERKYIMRGRQEAVMSVVGGMAAPTSPVVNLPRVPLFEYRETVLFVTGGLLAAMPADDRPLSQMPVANRFQLHAPKPADQPELVPLGHSENTYHLRVMLNTKGASIQQVVLARFQHADREGLPVTEADGSKKPLHLIPGVRVPRMPTIREQRQVPVPELVPGKIPRFTDYLEHPSYVMYHYEKASDDHPVNTLGERNWKIVDNTTSSDGSVQTVSFETELGEPHYVKITKTYTLKRDEYHVGLNVTLTPSGRPEGVRSEGFRYQIDGPKGIPLEGEWYATTHRQGVVGWVDTRDNATRSLEDIREVRLTEGSDRLVGKDTKPIRYAGLMVQYFASVLALDNVQPAGQKPDYIEYIRFTPQGPTNKGKEFLDDMTFRAISKAVDAAVPVSHSYVLYQGPVKVRLLKQLKGAEAVPEETVERYKDALHLSTLTDAPMPNFLGRFANAIFWTDLVIVFTNIVHSLLGVLTGIIPSLGICIIVITVFVRGMLHPFSRRQSINAKIMQEKQAKVAPEMKKLTEKYGNDYNRLNVEKMKLYREHGINPAAAFGGCFLLLAQMPIFMGLYYALQESVFFRLEPFLWLPNLAAPDMLIWWTEKIPFISSPEDLGSTFYLGPYFNLLPMVAVGLMMYTQSKMMPKTDDPQMQMQQKTMKFMMVFMAFFFYKVAAGLCIYFIMSSVWGMIERRLIKNVKLPTSEPKGTSPADKPKPEAPKGWLGRKKAELKTRWEQLLEEAQKQQQVTKEPQKPAGNPRKKKK
ncbi:YidC/Oxa1 family insertase periplasmic-domain containing protein [Zavarzinella formosa]|uniref:YidC/Oxa1 family insertase periplasmic-domain containing protein n=1 Tax=Zavarzinella formosa TaxID=360055 RepID=UPI00030C81F5|nr:YidC/Oxa1 family insertase periplasmic-domain containing protein [Zavarzinella formosa]